MTRKETILTESAKLFRKRGFAATSMRDIAQAVGIEAPSLYNHIKSKDEILASLLLDVAQDFTDGMDEILKLNLSPFNTLKEVIQLHVNLTRTKTNQIALIVNEWRHLQNKAKTEFANLRENYEVNFRKIIERGIEDNSFKEVDIELALFSILSTLRWFYAWYAVNEERYSEELEKDLFTILLKGLIQ